MYLGKQRSKYRSKVHAKTGMYGQNKEGIRGEERANGRREHPCGERKEHVGVGRR